MSCLLKDFSVVRFNNVTQQNLHLSFLPVSNLPSTATKDSSFLLVALLSFLLFPKMITQLPTCPVPLLRLPSSRHPYNWLLTVDAFCHTMFALAPALWLLGILPPIDAYVLWILEQWLVLVLGECVCSSSFLSLQPFCSSPFWGLVCSLAPYLYVYPFTSLCISSFSLPHSLMSPSFIDVYAPTYCLLYISNNNSSNNMHPKLRREPGLVVNWPATFT